MVLPHCPHVRSIHLVHRRERQLSYSRCSAPSEEVEKVTAPSRQGVELVVEGVRRSLPGERVTILPGPGGAVPVGVAILQGRSASSLQEVGEPANISDPLDD